MHTVTAFYELIPAGQTQSNTAGEPFCYQAISPSDASDSDELFTVNLRYTPRGKTSKLLTRRAVLEDIDQPSENLRFASSVVEFGLLARFKVQGGRLI